MKPKDGEAKTPLVIGMCLFLVLMVVAVLAATTDVHETTLAIAGVSPTIPDQRAIPAQDPVSCSGTAITHWFVANDADGWENLNDSTAATYFTRAGETDRTNTTCSVENINTTANNYTCEVTMQFYDEPGAWDINVSISDIDGNYVENTTETFTWNTGVHTDINVTSISMGTGLDWGDSDIASTSDPQGVRNCGNVNLTQINVSAIDLVHTTYDQDYINASQWEVDGDDVADDATAMVNDTTVQIVDPAALFVERGASSYEELFYHMDLGTSAGRHAGTYDTTTWGNWTVGVGE